MTYCFHFLMPRRSDQTEAEFSRYWRDVHGPLVVEVSQLAGYEGAYRQSHRVDVPGTDAPYSGVAEAPKPTLDNQSALFSHPQWRGRVLADEPNFVDMANVRWMTTEIAVVVDGDPAASVKWVQFFRRAPGVTLDAFRSGLVERAAALAAVDGLERAEVCLAVPEVYPLASPPWDAIVHAYFRDAETATAALACDGADGWRAAVGAIAARPQPVMVCREHWMMRPPNGS